MDISIYNTLSIIGIILPFIYALYLFFARITLTFVDKKVLNYGCSVANLISFLIFVLLKFVSFGSEKIAKIDFNFLNIEKFSLDFGIFIDENNIIYLIFTSFLCFLVSIYSKIYFDKKKKYIFTKQRFYIFLSLISFMLYLFIASSNLFQGIMMLILQSALVAIFAHFDIFKHPKNFNISRFHRISLLGNFSFLIAILVLFRYAILSKGYILSNSLSYSELNMLLSYTYGISSSFEFKLIAVCLILAIMTRLMIFPFSCYYSFFANSSNVMYLSVALLVNNIAGMFLYLKIIPLIQMFKNGILILISIAIIGILFSLIQILFERNIKIIFGYFLSVINSIFIILFLYFNPVLIQNSYFGLNILFAVILMLIFINDAINFKKRLINKQTGFVLEKTHIVLLEVIPQKIANVFDLIDEKIIQNISTFFVCIFNYLSSLFVVKTIRTTRRKSIGIILFIIALFIIIAIFMTLFGGVK